MMGPLTGSHEAHNGYLELYLNLGWIGVALLAGVIVMSYPKVIATFRADPACRQPRTSVFCFRGGLQFH